MRDPNAYYRRFIQFVQQDAQKNPDEQGLDPNSYAEQHGNSLLTRAVKNDDLEGVKTMLACGADPSDYYDYSANLRERPGCTPVLACYENIARCGETQLRLDILKLLLEQGAHPKGFYREPSRQPGKPSYCRPIQQDNLFALLLRLRMKALQLFSEYEPKHEDRSRFAQPVKEQLERIVFFDIRSEDKDSMKACIERQPSLLFPDLDQIKAQMKFVFLVLQQRKGLGNMVVRDHIMSHLLTFSPAAKALISALELSVVGLYKKLKDNAVEAWVSKWRNEAATIINRNIKKTLAHKALAQSCGSAVEVRSCQAGGGRKEGASATQQAEGGADLDDASAEKSTYDLG